MNNRVRIIYTLIALLPLVWTGCSEEGPQGPQGPAGQDAEVYFSEWFSPSDWSGSSDDWYFEASAPDLTEDIVENGVVLAYCWLVNDLYDGSTIRPLPAYAVGANWSFLIYQYGSMEFTCDMTIKPSTANKFRFIAIPGSIIALKSSTFQGISVSDLKKMPYKDICKLFDIPE